MAEPTRPLPQATAATRPFWDAAREGRLLVQKCNACAALQFFPRLFCLACTSQDLGWQQSTGLGVIYTFTVNHRASSEALKARVPYAVAVVTLDDGVRMMGQVRAADLSAVHIGARVKAGFEHLEGVSLPVFELVEPVFPQSS